MSWWVAAVNVPPSMMFEQSRIHHHALEKIWVSVASMASDFESLAGISKLAILGEESLLLRRSLSSVPANSGGSSGFSCCPPRWRTETVSAQTESHEKRVYDGSERESGTKTLHTFTMRRRSLFCKLRAETECERCKSVKQHVYIGMRHVGPRCCRFHRHAATKFCAKLPWYFYRPLQATLIWSELTQRPCSNNNKSKQCLWNVAEKRENKRHALELNLFFGVDASCQTRHEAAHTTTRRTRLSFGCTFGALVSKAFACMSCTSGFA